MRHQSRAAVRHQRLHPPSMMDRILLWSMTPIPVPRLMLWALTLLLAMRLLPWMERVWLPN